MKNTLKYLICFTALLLTNISNPCNAQDKFLKIKGKVLKRYDQKRLKAPVQIQAVSTCGDTTSIKTSNGKYKLYLSPGCDYEVHYKSENYVDKFFAVETINVPRQYRKKRFKLPVDIMMVRNVDGLDTSIYKYAQGKAFFHKVLRTFVWDPDFTSKAIIKADSAWMNIAAGDSLEVIEEKPEENVKEKPFEPIYLIVLQKDIPTKKIISDGYELTKKGLYFDTVQHGMLYAKMNLYFIAKAEDGFQNLCGIYKGFTKINQECIETLDQKPNAYSQPLFKLGVIIEQLHWITTKEVFAMIDYDDLIVELDKELKNWDISRATDHVLGMHADFNKIIEHYDAIQANDEFSQNVTAFKNLIKEIYQNLK